MQTPEEYEITERVNALVKGLKKRRGYTKKDISQKLGIGLTTFNDYLNGVSSFKLGTLIKFAALCKLTLPDILDDTLEAKKLYSEDLADRANAGKNTLDFLAFILIIPAATSALATQWLFFFLHLLLVVYSRKDLNCMVVNVVFLLVYLLADLFTLSWHEYIYPNYNGLIQNTTAFGFPLLTNCLLMYFIKNRMQLSVWLSKGRNKEVLEPNKLDAPVYIVLVSLVFADSIAILENILRNLEHFGIDEEFARQFWKVQYIYDNYEYIKVFLMALVIILLFIGTRIRQRQLRLALGESGLGMNT
ncbi:helix-turn-helix domain-containing protein [Pseudoalteromonas xiamenensis]